MSQLDLVWRLFVALALATVVGAEREIRQKNAGMRTYALVGVGAALFMLISQYGFNGVLSKGTVVVDPSRVAAGVVSGIGFIGGGLIFVHRANVRGLTTAAGIWTTAAIGMAAGADLVLLAAATTVIYLIVSWGYPFLTSRMPSSSGMTSPLRITYADGQGVLRRLVAECAEYGFAVAELTVERSDGDVGAGDRTVTVRLGLRGRGAVADLIAELDSSEGVISAQAGDVNVPEDA